MKHLRLITVCQIIAAFLGFSFTAKEAVGRSIFLNGVDITNSTDQKLKGIDLYIDDSGNIMITAPHYRVYKENHLKPLSSVFKEKKPALKHKKPQQLPRA